MYIVLQYLYAVLKRIEIYIGTRPKLLLAAVILFSGFWVIFGQEINLGQSVFGFTGQNSSEIIKEETFSRKNSISPSDSFLTANSSAVFNLSPAAPVLTVLTDESAAEYGEITEEENSLAALQETAFLAQSGPITFVSQEARNEIITYIVQSGDTPSAVAASFGITTDTLFWANSLKDGSIIRPGDELVILPITGILHRVKSGETVGGLANYYKARAEEIISFNGLPADGSISSGEKLIIPDGQIPLPPKPKTYAVSNAVKQINNTGPGTGKSRAFPWGQCTFYVAQKRIVPWSGNAKDWLYNARAMGYSVCFGSSCQPRTGAIISLYGDTWLIRRYGHVAYVEAVKDNWVTISEMNYLGLGVKSVRTINKGSSLILGYIY